LQLHTGSVRRRWRVSGAGNVRGDSEHERAIVQNVDSQSNEHEQCSECAVCITQCVRARVQLDERFLYMDEKYLIVMQQSGRPFAPIEANYCVFNGRRECHEWTPSLLSGHIEGTYERLTVCVLDCCLGDGYVK
jgi:NAD-dependent dihydropyrimidine dehydrogenase PreA subunit